MTSAMTDIASRADIERLVNDFYERVRGDDLLGPIFDEVAHTDWVRHLPKMYKTSGKVCCSAYAQGFRGNPLAVHRELASRVALGDREFGRWLDLFHTSVDTLFSGPCAEDAKARAWRIAAVMRHHISSLGDSVRSTV